jgi:large subunit ribosomal protein L15
MPLNRRLPKIGFRSKLKAQSQEVFLYQLANLKGDVIDVVALHQAGLIDSRAKKVKVVLKGEIGRAVKLSGLLATAGAKAAIEAAGGSVE